MIIKIDDAYGEIEIEEFLEPTGACYEIRQGENKILFHTNYLMEELSNSIQFMLYKEQLCKNLLQK